MFSKIVVSLIAIKFAMKVKQRLRCFYCAIALLFACLSFGQEITLLQQFNGKYDFTFIGNTLNLAENNSGSPCVIATSSSASLFLPSGNVIEKAYLYWAGSGFGDFNVSLNSQIITASRTFSHFRDGRNFFSAYADVTALVQAEGQGFYTLSELNLTNVIANSSYCNTGTNFGGWAIIIVYSNESLPLNQLNIYDGLRGLQGSVNNPQEITINLDGLYVIDNEGAKIGFIAWEGDKALSVSESLTLNGDLLSNTLNPETNAFNGTSTVTGSDELYNMDLDIYAIDEYVNVGDQSAEIELTSGSDFVMINCIVTKFNSELPDATITIDATQSLCGSRTVSADFTVYNLNSTDPLPANVPIAIFADGILVGATVTTAEIPIGESQSGSVNVEIPIEIPNDFVLTFVVDQNASGAGTVIEINEDNNTDEISVSLLPLPAFNAVPNLEECNTGLGKARFNFSEYATLVKMNPDDVVRFFSSADDAAANEDEILGISDFEPETTPKEIFIRIEDDNGCFSITSFLLLTRNCPPQVYNLVARNVDNFYDTFLIVGLRDIFLNFQLSIYNRWGILVWTGNNNTPDFDGTATKGMRIMGSELPDGTYFYILELNDPDYPNPLSGFLELTR